MNTIKTNLTFLSIILFTILILTTNPASANTPQVPETIQITSETQELTQITPIGETENYKYYATKEDIAKTLTSKQYQTSKHWQIRIFVEQKNEKDIKIFLERLEKSLSMTQEEIDFWAIGYDLKYDERLYITLNNKTLYNRKGIILTNVENTPYAPMEKPKRLPLLKRDYKFYKDITIIVKEYLDSKLELSKNINPPHSKNTTN